MQRSRWLSAAIRNNHCNPFAQTISLSVIRSLSLFILGDRGAVSLRQFTDNQLICRLPKKDPQELSGGY
jgi:hypothetical protein